MGSHTIPAATLTVTETEVFNGTSPTSWTDFDLSGTVGANAALILLKIRGIENKSVAVRKNGDTDEFYQTGTYAAGAAAFYGKSGAYLVVIAATDSAGKIEWKTEDAQTYTVDIIAFIK